LGSTLSILLFKLSAHFAFLSFAITIFTFFQTSINPMSDAITLEYSYSRKWKFGYVRLAGTLGFALMSALSGMLLAKGVDKMFYIYFTLGVISLALAVFLPKVKGHQTKAKKVPVWALLKDRKLLLLISFALIIQITISYFSTFFGIYYQQLGASKSLLGYAYFISSFSEVPFLLFSHKILKKVKPEHALIFAGITAGIRWIILGTVSNIYIILASQALHGVGFIIIMVTLAMYVNEHAPQELKASGQALIGLVNAGASKIIASLFGGYLSDIFGLKQMFINNFFIAIIAILIFSIIFYRNNVKLGMRNEE
jgi:MFS transporter, PPP family, 3-phenylpropionic acid transporter